jgi:hypothetical protein
MKIAILGTRGIPNQYGGFEEFAENISFRWISSGHEVIVYCEGDKYYEDQMQNGVQRIFIKTYQKYLRGFYLFLYDFTCTRHAINQKCDIFYHAGYQSSVIGNMILSRWLHGKLIYNMDGLEWKRSKWSPFVQRVTRVFERIAAKSGAYLIADNKGIQQYLFSKYGVSSHLVAYGANIVMTPKLEVLELYNLTERSYNILIARFEPENNVEVIIKAHVVRKKKLVVVANRNTKHYKKLHSYINENAKYVKYLGSIYDKDILNSLRFYSNYYLHGHTVGGTNPSLLEALASSCKILAHDNIFNRDVLNKFGYYWSSQFELEELLDLSLHFDDVGQKNYLFNSYNWDDVATQHLRIFKRMI